MSTNYELQAGIFKAFCDVRRLLILEALRDGEECACNLADQLDMPQSTFSYHMKILCDAGIVDSKQDGKWTHYSLSPVGREQALNLLSEITKPHATADHKINSCVS